MIGFGYKLITVIVISVGLLAAVNMTYKDKEQLNIEKELRIMSYNIRYDNPGDGINQWTNRRERVANLVRFNSPDIIGMQEVLYSQLTWLDDHLKGYDWEGVGRTNGEMEGEFSPIFYNSERLEKLDSGTFWLSPTPEEPSKGWDAALPRICTWVRLRDLSTDKEFLVFNTHFDHKGEQAREESANVIMQKIAEISEENIPVILTGDFNTQPGSKPYEVFTEQLDDACHSSEISHYGPAATYLDEDGGFSVAGGEGGRRIDYIFTNQQVKIKRHGILSTFRDGRFPSDHLPVVADITF